MDAETKKDKGWEELMAIKLKEVLGIKPFLIDQKAEVYSFRSWIVGPDFCAGVDFTGWVFAGKEEEGTFSFCGVVPGSVSACGETLEEARGKFLGFIAMVLTDLASDSTCFDDFAKKLKNFVNEANFEVVREWLEVAEGDQKSQLPGLHECVCASSESECLKNAAGEEGAVEGEKEEKTAETDKKVWHWEDGLDPKFPKSRTQLPVGRFRNNKGDHISLLGSESINLILQHLNKREEDGNG